MPFVAWAQSDFFIKEVVFPDGATPDEKLEMASRVVPSSKQLEWQNLEMTAFLHFGINTFTDREWGNGSESETLFNPVGLDADQWVRILKDAGFRMVILTAKHHDGFCLWPTETTSHSVKFSPWRDGKGDVMAELSKACTRYGMKLGVYLSPWDRNARCYGDSPAYNDMFVKQLTELLSNYGRIDEVWFDGACGEGPNGKRQEYDWSRYKSVIESIQPDAVVAIMGDDIRWVGNEKGLGRETEWSVTALTPGILPDADAVNKRLGLFPKAPDLGGKDIVSKADKLYWWPSEVDVSIRPGWFWHAGEKPKSLRQLAEIYLHSVGRNSVLLLNVPPTPKGLIDSTDSMRLVELKEWIDSNFTKNLVASSGKNNITAEVVNTPFNCVVLREDISRGQRVEEFNVMAKTGDGWRLVSTGTTIGNKRILTFADCQADSLRIDIVSARGDVTLRPIEVYCIKLPSEQQDITDVACLDKTKWKLLEAGNACANDGLHAAFDNDIKTVFVTNAGSGRRHVQIDLNGSETFGGFVYTPRNDDENKGTIYRYRFLVSNNPAGPWTCVVTGEFSNILNNPIPQFIYFDAPVTAGYFSLECVEEVEGRDCISVAEVSLIR